LLKKEGALELKLVEFNE